MSLFLLSDFGISDTYVAQMKAVILRMCGDRASLIDLTHTVPCGSVREGAWHLMVSSPFIPAGSVVLAVVDPGVGSSRKALAVTSSGVAFIGPDNGIFSWLPPDRAFLLPESAAAISYTFHGRDLFAPAAAKILLDPSWLEGLAEVPVDSLVRITKGCCMRSSPDGLSTTVAHVDGFGNAVLWMTWEETKGFDPKAVVTAAGVRVKLTAAETYCGDSGTDLLILQGSQGYMELAVSMGSAASRLALSAGDAVSIEGSYR